MVSKCDRGVLEGQAFPLNSLKADAEFIRVTGRPLGTAVNSLAQRSDLNSYCRVYCRGGGSKDETKKNIDTQIFSSNCNGILVENENEPCRPSLIIGRSVLDIINWLRQKVNDPRASLHPYQCNRYSSNLSNCKLRVIENYLYVHWLRWLVRPITSFRRLR